MNAELAFTGRTLAQELGDGWGVHAEDRDRCFSTRWVFDRGGPVNDSGGRFAD